MDIEEKPVPYQTADEMEKGADKALAAMKSCIMLAQAQIEIHAKEFASRLTGSTVSEALQLAVINDMSKKMDQMMAELS